MTSKETMKVVRWYGPRDMRVEEMPKPTPEPWEVLVRVDSVGVCGSDMHYYLEGRIGNQVIADPLILGHEYAGLIEAVGAKVSPELIGKLVAVEPGVPCMQCEWCRTGHYNVCKNMFFPGGPGCDGAFCEYMVVHADFCHPVPETMSAATAAMVEPVAVAVHTVELAAIKPGETVAITGMGPIGLLTAQLAKQSGAYYIFGADLHEYRVIEAPHNGVDIAINAEEEDAVERILSETQGRGVDVAIDCSNSAAGFGNTIRVARPAGRCVLTGISGNDEDLISVSVARRHELNLQWCRRFRHNYPTALRLVASGLMEVDRLITHSFPLEKTQEAMEMVSTYSDEVLKASIDRD